MLTNSLIFNSSKIEPLDGISILPYIYGYKEEIYSKSDVFAFEHSGNVMLKKGNWKIINLNLPFEIDNFNLYSKKNDITKLYDKRSDFNFTIQIIYFSWWPSCNRGRDDESPRICLYSSSGSPWGYYY